MPLAFSSQRSSLMSTVAAAGLMMLFCASPQLVVPVRPSEA